MIIASKQLQMVLPFWQMWDEWKIPTRNNTSSPMNVALVFLAMLWKP